MIKIFVDKEFEFGVKNYRSARKRALVRLRTRATLFNTILHART